MYIGFEEGVMKVMLPYGSFILTKRYDEYQVVLVTGRQDSWWSITKKEYDRIQKELIEISDLKLSILKQKKLRGEK